MLTGKIEHVIPHGERNVPLEAIVGSISGSQASICSLYNAASMFTVDARLIWMNQKIKFNEMKKENLITSDDQFWTSAVKLDKHIATTVFVTEPKPTSSLTSIVSNVKINLKIKKNIFLFLINILFILVELTVLVFLLFP